MNPEARISVIFDLDHTLLDTTALFDAMEDAAMKYGITSAQFRAGREQATSSTKDQCYDLTVHAGFLRKHFPNDKAANMAIAEMETVAANSHQFLFEGAIALLSSLKQRPEVRMMMLTYGSHKWQMTKLIGSGILPFFDDVRTTLLPKYKLLMPYATYKLPLVLVNDNAEEMLEMRNITPHAELIVKRGPKPVPEGFDIVTVESMAEIGRLINLVIDKQTA